MNGSINSSVGANVCHSQMMMGQAVDVSIGTSLSLKRVIKDCGVSSLSLLLVSSPCQPLRSHRTSYKKSLDTSTSLIFKRSGRAHSCLVHGSFLPKRGFSAQSTSPTPSKPQSGSPSYARSWRATRVLQTTLVTFTCSLERFRISNVSGRCIRRF